MAVITISREFGSEGDTIAEKVAEGLGYHLAGKDRIGAMLSQYGLVEFDKEYDTVPGFWERFNAQREQRRDLMAAMLTRVVRALARHGNVVIVGRSGFAILRDFADVLNVRIQSPFVTRTGWVMAQQAVPAEQAEAIVRENDKVRSAFIESFYKAHWDAASAFDLVLDTSKISPEMASAWVIQAGARLDESPAIGLPASGSIEVDPVLAGVVSNVLGCQITHRS